MGSKEMKVKEYICAEPDVLRYKSSLNFISFIS